MSLHSPNLSFPLQTKSMRQFLRQFLQSWKVFKRRLTHTKTRGAVDTVSQAEKHGSQTTADDDVTSFNGARRVAIGSRHTRSGWGFLCTHSHPEEMEGSFCSFCTALMWFVYLTISRHIRNYSRMLFCHSMIV